MRGFQILCCVKGGHDFSLYDPGVCRLCRYKIVNRFDAIQYFAALLLAEAVALAATFLPPSASNGIPDVVCVGGTFLIVGTGLSLFWKAQIE